MPRGKKTETSFVSYIVLYSAPCPQLHHTSSNDIQKKKHFYAFSPFFFNLQIRFKISYNFNEERLSLVCINVLKMLMWKGLEKTCLEIIFLD